MEVQLINTGEGMRTIPDANGRDHNIPCGHLVKLDVPDAFANMFSRKDSSNTLVIVPEGTKLPKQFLELLALLRSCREMIYDDMLREAVRLLGKDTLRMRPHLNEIRERIRKIVVAFVMQDFKNFDDVMERDRKVDPTAPVVAAPPEARQMTLNNQRAVPNIPQAMRRQMAIRETAEQMLGERMPVPEGDELTKDPRVAGRVTQLVLGRVPTPDVALSHRALNPIAGAAQADYSDAIKEAQRLAADMPHVAPSLPNAAAPVPPRAPREKASRGAVKAAAPKAKKRASAKKPTTRRNAR